jgi:ABC-2 type transport system ATP-binding protein
VTETALSITGTPEPDGRPVDLDVSILTTAPSTPRPAIVLAHGFGGTKADSAQTGRSLARSGYTVITYTARGFGTSGGRIHLNDPAFEGADARKVVDLAAQRPEVLKDAGDPVVGFAGGSYGGAISLVVAGLDPRVDAIAPAFTWSSLTQALFPQYAVTAPPTALADVSPVDQTGVFKQRWASLFFLGAGGREQNGTGEGSDLGLCGRFSAELCQGYLQTAESGRPDPGLVRLLDRSNPERLLAHITAPTLLIQGETDTLFPLDHADANLRGLPASTPAKMVWVEGGHDTQIDIDALLPHLEAWFGRYLKRDGSAPDTSFQIAVPKTSLVGQDPDQDTPVLTAASYPGRNSALQTSSFPLSGGAQTFISPPGGTPAALTNLPGTGGALGTLSSVGGYALGVLPGQSATFTTPPLTEPVTLAGSGSLELSVTSTTPDATLFISLWDLGPDTRTTPDPAGRGVTATPGTAVLPGLAVAPVRLGGLRPNTPQTVRVALPPVAHQVPVGHRMQVVASSTDQAYAVPSGTSVYRVDLGASEQLVLPRLQASAADPTRLDVPMPLVIVVSGLVLAGLAGMVLLWLRRRHAHPREDLRNTPLLVQDLVKTYGDGFRAVDGVSFAAERGQVVGLLGPNGAGKTTTMRMLVGLIRPDSGTIHVHGDPVHAGADVLVSVGAFIEGPGFLPHLTGWANLQAYWQATGRPIEEAHLDEALAIAGLGAAIHRTVRGYSQGMRQRLGIAQSMLGLPSLLLLDEPTNGLDPPQIKAMRSVLADYAASGRTVVVSSHLLSEVEQTCSHVVVMHRGTVILTGSMAELTATDDVTLVGLAEGSDVEAAQVVLRRAGLATVVENGVIRATGTLPRSEVVARLVEAGYPVESVDGRRQLEEVFMSLVGPPGQEADGTDAVLSARSADG